MVPQRRQVTRVLLRCGAFWVGLVLSAAGGSACDDPGGHPPIARITISPGAIPENDGFQTAVTLDGAGSADPIDDPAGETPLRYLWQIEGDEHRFESGGDTAVKPVVRFGGDRPASIRLTVIDGDDLEASVVEHLRLTIR